ncbi:hypothetical protein TBLA_0A04210 [Henningerozyma blattae CBS 6284]|uniref:Nudix hydrolase domain-containing protein n=1 Tax=Henningerozyma blattae (strain ATCC 34711 / CBS 6284 / DSM 70876 / NBRC 10599 / NRRL Y-10934 / UCD 77-7) TaxID=1071380 RepID=I2GVR5_HENB6|nr:hypothetical protein TBLA_0A04210 [Tetrapisispora blattae CBS 6284]CCH58217.1 hypothetical protein TBLA_0A04210 [Tetrapisispora blattae CBS 6284]
MNLPKPITILNNIRRFKNINRCPLQYVWPENRRSVVLILLFIDQNSKLRVLLTKRSRKLRAFAGHVSFPGGKADNKWETFEEIARREAEEEIGLPRNNDILRGEYGLEIETISDQIPCYLSHSLLSVKPMVCFLYNTQGKLGNEGVTRKYEEPLNINKFFGKLNPGETSSLFSIPLLDPITSNNGLREKLNNYQVEYFRKRRYFANWGGLKWDVKHFYYDKMNSNETSWLEQIDDLSGTSGESGSELENGSGCEGPQLKRDVWGLTARILYDLGGIGINLETQRIPLQSVNRIIGNEDLIEGLWKSGASMINKERNAWEKQLIDGGSFFKEYVENQYLSRYRNAKASILFFFFS